MEAQSIHGRKRLIRDIRKMIRRGSTARYFHRLHVVYLVLTGVSVQEAGELFGDSTRSIRTWLRRLDEVGSEGMRDKKRYGRHSRINVNTERLGKLLCRSPRELGYSKDSWSGPLLEEHLWTKHHIDLGKRQCQRVLRMVKNTPKGKPFSLPSEKPLPESFYKWMKEKRGLVGQGSTGRETWRGGG